SSSTNQIPNYEIPLFDDLGGNECLVDVTHGAVDFVAAGENDPVGELNLWYHLLNCGFALPMIGETDFWSQNALVGATRTYVKLHTPPTGDVGYSSWLEGVRAGRLYFGDGRSHLIDYCANDQLVGEGQLRMPKATWLDLSVKVAARLDSKPFNVEAKRQRQ